MPIGCYVRVSTEDQSVDRQLDATSEYAQREFDLDVADLEVYRNRSTGTDVDRSGYQELMADAEDGLLEAVMVQSVSRISRSISDLDRTASRLADAGVELHIVSEGLRLRPDDDDPYQRALFQLLGVFAELEARGENYGRLTDRKREWDLENLFSATHTVALDESAEEITPTTTR